MSSVRRSTMLVGLNLKDASANFEILKKELAKMSDLCEKGEQLDAQRAEFDAQKFELEVARSEFIAKQLEWDTKRKAELAQLEGEKAQVRIAQSQLKTAQNELEDAKCELEYVQCQLETTRAQLEEAMNEAEIDSRKLETAKGSLKAAEARLETATKQLKAANDRFEAAKKTLEDAAAAASSGNKDNKLNDNLVAELSQSKAQVESLLERLRENEDDKKAMQEKVEELVKELLDQETKASEIATDVAAELSQSNAQMENLFKKLRYLEEQEDDMKALREKVEEMKKRLMDQETNATKNAKDLSKSKAQVESLTNKLSDQEKQLDQSGREEEAKKKTIEELRKQLLERLKRRMNNNRNPIVFFEITIKGTFAGTIVIELFADTTPRLAENFRALCTGEKGVGRNGKPLYYKGTEIRVGGMALYGGDRSNESIYGENTIIAESAIRKHTGLGDVAMIGAGKYGVGKGSEFQIIVDKNDFYKDSTMVGRVLEGLSVILKIAKDGIHNSLIVECGQIS